MTERAQQCEVTPSGAGRVVPGFGRLPDAGQTVVLPADMARQFEEQGFVKQRPRQRAARGGEG